MFTNLSHEIRTPLNFSDDASNKFREKEQRPQQKEIYNLMYRKFTTYFTFSKSDHGYEKNR